MIIKFCPSCGEKLIEGKAFCANCGERISTDLSQNQTPEAVNDRGAVVQPSTQNPPSQEVLKRFGLKSATYPSQPNVTEIPSNQMINNSSDIIDKQEELNKIISSKEQADDPSTPLSVDNEVPRKKRKENKKSKNLETFKNSFFSMGYADEQSQSGPISPKVVTDNLYNESTIDLFEEESEKEEVEQKKTRTRKSSTTLSQKPSRATSSPRTRSAVVKKTTEIVAKKVITEDKALNGYQKVYIIEQDEMADPDDPNYDGYYENVKPIDEDGKNSKLARNKISLNDEIKKTLLVLLALVIALFVIIAIQF